MPKLSHVCLAVVFAIAIVLTIGTALVNVAR